MRLLKLKDDGEFSLIEFIGNKIPRYAILSHTWEADGEEVTFKDLMKGTGKSKAGYQKIRFCGEQAVTDNLQYFWVDTCCINKSSSAELSEAINSMFRWYHDAGKCYVYLSDVSISGSIKDDQFSQWIWEQDFRKSRWFTRGWTLQELIAPASVEFFSVEGERLGDKKSLERQIHEITGITAQALQGSPLSHFSVNKRMSWAAKRETKREEDAAYSLLGIFDIHMPLIYGEGRKKALVRLYKEIGEPLELTKGHQEEQDSLHKGWDEQRKLMLSQHKSTTDDLHQNWGEKHAQATALADEERKREDQFEEEKNDLQRRWEEERERADQFEKEKDDLQRRWEEERKRADQFEEEKDDLQRRWEEERKRADQFEKEKQDCERAFNELKTVAEYLGTEKGKLEKLIQAFGDVTDIKSKGDAYYLEAFSQLFKQILDLSNTHFTHFPITSPADILSLIPPGIPSFLDDTASSRELRAAYVAHTISKILTFRVFTPFLFSLGRRFDKADGLFTAMSNQLRGKSTRKEAIWRQHTLVAAFTSSGAKQRINSAAGSVVEEIINAIKYFTNPSEEDAIRVSMRQIVKLAAETWRFARLEREMITAKMPAVDDDSEEYKGVDFWPAQTFNSARYALPVNAAVEQFQERPKILLRLFPVIRREAMHECFRITEEEKEDNGCVYSYGFALYDNATPLVAREEELRQAGLPHHSNLSSSASEFLPTVPEPGEDKTKRLPLENFAEDTESQHHNSGYPMPPKSQAGTPPSPLFAAVSEIDGIRQPSHRMLSLNRRSTGSLMPRSIRYGARRPSGYTISNMSSMGWPRQ